MNRRAAALGAALLVGLPLLGAGTGRGFFFTAEPGEAPLPLDDDYLRGLREAIGRRPPPSGSGAGEPAPLFRILGMVVDVLVLAALAAVAAAALYAMWRGLRALRLLLADRPSARTEPPPYDVSAEDDDADTPLRRRLRREVAAGYADLDATPVAREAVVACWLRLRDAVRAAGTPPLPTETPEELVVRVLGAHAVPADSLRRLAALYEHARFSPHPVDEPMRAAARRCLDEIAAMLDAPVPA